MKWNETGYRRWGGGRWGGYLPYFLFMSPLSPKHSMMLPNYSQQKVCGGKDENMCRLWLFAVKLWVWIKKWQLHPCGKCSNKTALRESKVYETNNRTHDVIVLSRMPRCWFSTAVSASFVHLTELKQAKLIITTLAIFVPPFLHFRIVETCIVRYYTKCPEA